MLNLVKRIGLVMFKKIMFLSIICFSSNFIISHQFDNNVWVGFDSMVQKFNEFSLFLAKIRSLPKFENGPKDQFGVAFSPDQHNFDGGNRCGLFALANYLTANNVRLDTEFKSITFLELAESNVANVLAGFSIFLEIKIAELTKKKKGLEAIDATQIANKINALNAQDGNILVNIFNFFKQNNLNLFQPFPESFRMAISDDQNFKEELEKANALLNKNEIVNNTFFEKGSFKEAFEKASNEAKKKENLKKISDVLSAKLNSQIDSLTTRIESLTSQQSLDSIDDDLVNEYFQILNLSIPPLCIFETTSKESLFKKLVVRLERIANKSSDLSVEQVWQKFLDENIQTSRGKEAADNTKKVADIFNSQHPMDVGIWDGAEAFFWNLLSRGRACCICNWGSNHYVLLDVDKYRSDDLRVILRDSTNVNNSTLGDQALLKSITAIINHFPGSVR